MEDIKTSPALEADKVEDPESERRLPVLVEDYDKKLIQAKAFFEAFRAEAERLKKEVFALKVSDDKTQAEIAELKAIAQSVVKKIEDRLDGLFEKPKALMKAIKNTVGTITKPLEDAKAEADRKFSIRAAYVKQERLRQEKEAQEAIAREQAKMDKKADKVGIPRVQLPLPAMGPIKTIVRTDSGSTFEVARWKGTVTNEDDVERIYCSSDSKKIKKAVDGGVRNPNMKGVNIEEITTPQTRTK
jgi:septal ring factor EnvC (AmiA/AmiB activator)